MKYRLTHTTTYEYENPVLHGRHVIKKRPRSLPFQQVQNARVEVFPLPVWRSAQEDYYGNQVDSVELLSPHDTLKVVMTADVTVGPRNVQKEAPLFRQSWETARDRISRELDLYEARDMQTDSPMVRRHQELLSFAQKTFSPGRFLLDGVLEFNQRIFQEFTYDPQFSDVATPLDQVLAEKRGVCQDFAHVAVGALRSLGLAARYVSGYLETLPPPGKARLVGADASHAWASVYIPDHGWVGLDPTNGVLPGERHIVVGWGRDFSDVSPLRGVVLGGGRHTVKVGVDVAPVTEFPGQVQQQVRQQSAQQQQQLMQQELTWNGAQPLDATSESQNSGGSSSS